MKKSNSGIKKTQPKVSTVSKEKKEKKAYAEKKHITLMPASSGEVVSVIYKTYNPISREFESKEVTAFVKDKTRMVYIVILGDFHTPDGTAYQYFRRYINPSQIIAVKKVERSLGTPMTFRTEYEFTKWILSSEQEINKSMKLGKE